MTRNTAVCCVVLGGGGHAKVLIDCLGIIGHAKILGILDPDTELWGKILSGVPVLGADNMLPDLVTAGVNSFVVGAGSIGNSQIRQKLFEFGLANGLQPLSVIHPAATISTRVELAWGVQILAASVINAGARIGKNVIVNSGAIVEHDCEISDHVHIATGAKLSGGVRVGSGAHIGAGATIRQNIVIGDGAVVGIGAAVVKDVQPYSIVVGVPAGVRRKIQTSTGFEGGII